MYLLKNKFIVLQLAVMVMLTSCGKTSLVDSWVDEELPGDYKHPMIIGVSDSQQTRQIYEKHFVSELEKRGVSATPSYKLINSKQEINRETVASAIRGTQIDAVLVSYLVSSEVTLHHRDSPLGSTYSGTAEGSEISATIVSNRGRSSSEEVFVIKSDFYDVRSKKLVWSLQTETVGPDSIDEVIIELTETVIDNMSSDDLIK